MKKLSGFTLAEVLIAMAVLGVVAALTIPHVMGDTTKKQYITAYKATVSNLQNAAKTNKAEQGYDFSGNRTVTTGSATIRNILETKLGATLTKLKTANQWQVQGLIASDYEKIGEYSSEVIDPETSSPTGETSTFDLKTQAFLTTEATKINGNTLNTAMNISMGHTNDADYQATGNKYYGDTLKLPNGAYIFIPTNSVGCNFDNVRWDNTDSKYLTPNHAAIKNSDANTNLCLALIDVNGPKGPNRITNCLSNSVITSPLSTASCENMTAKEVGDTFPVFFYDDKVSPATAAGYTILNDLLNE